MRLTFCVDAPDVNTLVAEHGKRRAQTVRVQTHRPLRHLHAQPHRLRLDSGCLPLSLLFLFGNFAVPLQSAAWKHEDDED
eukprot:CAMPEP_0168347546 /NCGR_PEP_ID=MMETSP0213-20121227/19077_1 /TAXON_ID=151035 /ORGANISM="Euplotes harpa, Strain FSP1.4" /LENGTH=79 /DNA_ID=CAMNT_0008356701 /DNA_START=1016 /DNA_END=1255 /DNA_ORIENTATION=-